MKRQTEEFLYLCLWSADLFLNPTFRNLTDSYEGWAYRRGLLPRLSLLEKRRFLERDSANSHDRLYRLTKEGRLHALGGRDPEERWSRSWDGRWRMVVFDVPVARNRDRRRLRRHLIHRHFGCLQDSVWITPDSLDEEKEILTGGSINAESLVLLEARPCAGETDAEIISGAWNFKKINARYSRYIKLLDQPPATTRNASSKSLLRWLAHEREAWNAAVASDPMLPESILPSDYLGKLAWSRRKEVLQGVRSQWKDIPLAA